MCLLVASEHLTYLQKQKNVFISSQWHFLQVQLLLG